MDWENVRVPEDIPICYGRRDYLSDEDKQMCHVCKAWALCTAVVIASRMITKANNEPVQLELFGRPT